MKLTLLSDIHDNIWNLQKALQMPALESSDAMLFCGDLCAPFIIKLLGKGYTKPILIVLGNNDGDLTSIIRVSHAFKNIHLHGEYFIGTFDGKAVAMNHYPDKARILAESGGFDVVCYGHNHTLNKDEKIGKTLFTNPGAIMGYHGGDLKEIPATFLILDISKLTTEVYEL